MVMLCAARHQTRKWLEAMIKEIKELEKTGCWKILTSLPPGAKFINCRWVYKLKFPVASTSVIVLV